MEEDLEGLKLRYIAMRLKDGEIRQNYYFFAKLKDTSRKLKSNEGILEWFSYEKALKCKMPVCAKPLIDNISLKTSCL